MWGSPEPLGGLFRWLQLIISGINYPNLIHSQGDVPENPPEKQFQTDAELLFDDDQENEEDTNLDYDEDSFY